MRLVRRELVQGAFNESDLVVVFFFRQTATHFLEAAIDEIGVHHIRFAVAAAKIGLAAIAQSVAC